MTAAYPITLPIIESDVVVIGAGFAGMVAAVAASEKGASVILVDFPKKVFSLDKFGPFYLNAIEPELQGYIGVSDSPESFYRQTLGAGGYRANETLVKNLCYKSYSAKKWLELRGVPFEKRIAQIPGSDFPRTNIVKDPRNVRTALERILKERKVRILKELDFSHFLVKDGTVGGSVFLGSSSQKTVLKAPSTILATGGFDADPHLLEMFDPRLSGISLSKPKRKDTILREVSKIGAILAGTAYNDLLLGMNVKGSRQDLPFHPSEYILIDSNGRRIVNEESSEDVELQILQSPLKKLWLAMSTDTISELPEPHQSLFWSLVKTGEISRIPAFIDQCDIDAMTLFKTLKSYNEDIASNRPDTFGKINRSIIKRSDVVVIPVTLFVRSTLGGVLIDEKTQVLTGNGRKVNGLFACGEASGGIHGQHCVPGNFMLDALVNGITAGEEAANQARGSLTNAFQDFGNFNRRTNA